MPTHNAPAPAATPNGFGAAAVLGAGIGSFALAVIAIAADRVPALGRVLDFYQPTGPLSGVTTTGIAIWLIAWGVLHYRWRNRNVVLGPIAAAALSLLVLGVLLTFPPVGDLF
jgi:MFS family permease